MSYINDLKLLLRFRNTSLYEEVSTTTMRAVGDNLYPSIMDGGGYSMSNTQYLVGDGPGGGGYSLGVTNAFTFGFWLNPYNPGVVNHPTTGVIESVSMPLISMTSVGSIVSPIMEIIENTTTIGENNITVSLNNGSFTASSGDYVPSVWHHFWIVYNGGSLLSIYIDGVLSVSETTSVPAVLSDNILDLYINHSLDGYDYNVSKNNGSITDIFLINVANTSDIDMQRVINDGIEYLVDNDYNSINIEKSTIYFNDPDTIKVTSSVDDMSYVYFGRNDGKILRGSPLMWETRREFSKNGESDLLELSDSDKGDTWDMVDGFLELKNTNVRL